MKAITKNGISYDVKFHWNKHRIFQLYRYTYDDNPPKWYDFSGLIQIAEKWYNCEPTNLWLNDSPVPCVRLSSEAKKALNIENIKKTIYIRLDSDPTEEFQVFFDKLIQSVRKMANSLKFTYINIAYGHICGSDCDEDYLFLHFNDKALSILNAFNALENWEDEIKFTSHFEEYGTTYHIDASNINELFELAAPKLKVIEERKEEERRKREKIRIVQEAVKNGAVSFRCESAPHDEDLSEVILTRPCPNSGSFVLTHRIAPEVFTKIKKYGVYYDADFLEECDMFFSAPGWRFGKEAIETLLKDGYKVFVDCNEVVK